MMGSSQHSAQPENCVDSSCAPLELRFNASALSSPNALYVHLSSSAFPNSQPVKTLVDSGSTHSFVDAQFAHRHLNPFPITPIPLRLFDGSSNSTITEAVELPLRFPSGNVTPIILYLTQLDSSCSMVLGHNWLSRYNPLIDWELGSIKLRASSTNVSASTSTEPAAAATQLPRPTSSAPPQISLINAAAFARAAKMEGSQVFQICLSDPAFAQARSTSVQPDKPDLSTLPTDYQDFADVFDKKKADKVPPHRPYDLEIKIEGSDKPPIGPIYSVSPSELEALRKFIDEHLNIGFIRPSKSPHGAPVLFVRKKDGSLRLCVDFRALNKITKRDRYPLPLLTDLLDAPRKARVYTKIDLTHAYHLVRIAEGVRVFMG